MFCTIRTGFHTESDIPKKYVGVHAQHVIFVGIYECFPRKKRNLDHAGGAGVDHLHVYIYIYILYVYTFYVSVLCTHVHILAIWAIVQSTGFVGCVTGASCSRGAVR